MQNKNMFKKATPLGKTFYVLSAILLAYGVFDFAYVMANSIKTVSSYIQLGQMSVGYAIVLILISVLDVLLKPLGLSAILFILTESREEKLATKKNEAAKVVEAPEKPKRKTTKKAVTDTEKKAEKKTTSTKKAKEETPSEEPKPKTTRRKTKTETAKETK